MVVVVVNHQDWSAEEVQIHYLRDDLEEVWCHNLMVVLDVVEFHDCRLPPFGPTRKQEC